MAPPAETPTECPACDQYLEGSRGHGRNYQGLSDAHHALLATKDARIRELVGIIRKVDAWNYGSSSEEAPFPHDEIKAALARSEGKP